MSDFLQKDFYDVDAIKDRMAAALKTTEWINIQSSDLGQALLAFGANVVHQEAVAFFTGLDQLFLSTVDIDGYLETIAKDRGVLAKTYTSATIAVTLRSNDVPRSFGPMDFIIALGGAKFYNIKDILIGTTDTTIILYQGSAVREASVPGQIVGNAWSFTQLSSPLAVLVGNEITQRYLLLPSNTLSDSIVIESTSSYAATPVRWNMKDTFFDETGKSKVFKVEKDFIGRYKALFGDGIYGEVYPIGDIVMCRYLLSSGSDISVSSTANPIILKQETINQTSIFTIDNISNVIPGSSEIISADLRLDIERKESTRNALVRDTDYINYLVGRSDVLKANVLFERNQNPPNIEFFNTAKYIVKPVSPGISFNDADVQSYVALHGLQTLEFKKVSPQIEKFNVDVFFTALAGVLPGSVSTSINSLLSNEFSYSSLGFEELISQPRVFNTIKDVFGLDTSRVFIKIQALITDWSSGNTVFNYIPTDQRDLSFIPKRYSTRLKSTTFGTNSPARDNGAGQIFGDVSSRVDFLISSPDAVNTAFCVNNMFFIGTGSNVLRVVDLLKTEGGVSSIQLQYFLRGAHFDVARNRLLTIEELSGTFKIASYSMPQDLFERDKFSYLQLNQIYTPTQAYSVTVAKPNAASTVVGFRYFNDHIYIIWTMPSGNHVLRRYRTTLLTVDAADTLYNGGELPLTNKNYKGFSVGVGAFASENVFYLMSDNGIDVVRNADVTSPAISTIEPDFFNSIFVSPTYSPPISWTGSDVDDAGNLYASRVVGSTTIVSKLSAISNLGTCTVKNLSTSTLKGIKAVALDYFNLLPRVHIYNNQLSPNKYGVYDLAFDSIGQTPIERAVGHGVNNVDSVVKVADIDYQNQIVLFDYALANAEFIYESDEDLFYTKEKMPELKDLIVTGS